MKVRANALAGEFHFISAPGAGTQSFSANCSGNLFLDGMFQSRFSYASFWGCLASVIRTRNGHALIQAAEISQQVKALAMLLAELDSSKNHDQFFQR